MGSMKSMEDIKGDRKGSWSMWVDITVPKEWDTRVRRDILREVRMRIMARQLALRLKGGDVMCMLMGRISIIRMPMSGSWAIRSEKKGRYIHMPIPMPWRNRRGDFVVDRCGRYQYDKSESTDSSDSIVWGRGGNEWNHFGVV